MSHFNRVAALLEGCPDPGGVLYPQPGPTPGRLRAPPPWRAYLPAVAELVLPAAVITVRRLAELLGLPVFEINRVFISLGLFFLPDAVVPSAAVYQLCSQLGVRVVP